MAPSEKATELLETPGPWLRVHRERAGISLRALSRRSGYSPGYLSRMETGEKPIPLNTGTLLANLIGEMHAENRRAS